MDFTSQKIPAIELQPWSFRGQLRGENWQSEALTGNLIETDVSSETAPNLLFSMF
jgi:hypothetical protein